MIAVGMWVQAIGIGLFAVSWNFRLYVGGAVLLGLGNAIAGYGSVTALISLAKYSR